MAHKLNEPVSITKNGEGDMVVMSMSRYAKLQLKFDLFTKLTVGQNQAASGDSGRHGTRDYLGLHDNVQFCNSGDVGSIRY